MAHVIKSLGFEMNVENFTSEICKIAAALNQHPYSIAEKLLSLEQDKEVRKRIKYDVAVELFRVRNSIPWVVDNPNKSLNIRQAQTDAPAS